MVVGDEAYDPARPNQLGSDLGHKGGFARAEETPQDGIACGHVVHLNARTTTGGDK
jgi:hypothetical protein